MQISSADLKRIPVITESGEFLGKIKYFDIDSDTGHILRYFIKQLLQPSGVLVHHSQITEITTEKIIVKDTGVKERISVATARKKIKINNANPVISKTKA